MKYRTLLIGTVLIGMGSVASYVDLAVADTQSDFVFYDSQIQALHHRVDARAAAGGMNAEALEALQGKQQELENQEAKVKASGRITPDEKTALALSIRQQQQRLNGVAAAAAPQVKHVDSASVPASTYVTPSGTTISGPAGQSPQQSGIIPLEGAAIMPEATTSAAPAMTAPTVTGPTVPVIHAPQPSMPVTEMPTQQ